MRSVRAVLLAAAVALAGCGSSGDPDRAAFEQAVVSNGFTKKMADCALDAASHDSGMSAQQLSAEYQHMLARAIPDSLTNAAYDALTVCGVSTSP